MNEPAFTFAEAVTLLSAWSQLSKADVQRDPTHAAEVVGARAIACRNVIRDFKDLRRDGLA
jgi:hypothetical protein